MACQKIPYPSRADAVRAAAKHSGAKVYACPVCDGAFHLSSKTKSQVKETRRRAAAERARE